MVIFCILSLVLSFSGFGLIASDNDGYSDGFGFRNQFDVSETKDDIEENLEFHRKHLQDMQEEWEKLSIKGDPQHRQDLMQIMDRSRILIQRLSDKLERLDLRDQHQKLTRSSGSRIRQRPTSDDDNDESYDGNIIAPHTPVRANESFNGFGIVAPHTPVRANQSQGFPDNNSSLQKSPPQIPPKKYSGRPRYTPGTMPPAFPRFNSSDDDNDGNHQVAQTNNDFVPTVIAPHTPVRTNGRSNNSKPHNNAQPINNNLRTSNQISPFLLRSHSSPFDTQPSSPSSRAQLPPPFNTSTQDDD